MSQSATPVATAVTTSQVLITPALADLERARPQSRPGEIVSLVANHWKDRFILTSGYGWLRLPD